MKIARQKNPLPKRLPRGATRGTLFMEVARMRLKDAAVLLHGSRYNCAIYIIGYAIECALKWAVVVRRGHTYLEGEFEHHSWDDLLDAAGLRKSLDANSTLKAVYSAIAEQWQPGMRYVATAYTPKQAEFLRAQFTAVFEWIEDTITTL